jgi:hypothetical protein
MNSRTVPSNYEQRWADMATAHTALISGPEPALLKPASLLFHGSKKVYWLRLVYQRKEEITMAQDDTRDFNDQQFNESDRVEESNRSMEGAESDARDEDMTNRRESDTDADMEDMEGM